MTDLIERTARRYTLEMGEDWDGLPGREQAKRYDAFWQALHELRDPTADMEAVAYTVECPGFNLHSFRAGGCAPPIYRAMFDQLLAVQ